MIACKATTYASALVYFSDARARVDLLQDSIKQGPELDNVRVVLSDTSLTLNLLHLDFDKLLLGRHQYSLGNKSIEESSMENVKLNVKFLVRLNVDIILQARILSEDPVELAILKYFI